MAFIVIEMDIPAQSIDSLNARCQRSGKPHAAVVELRNLCDALLGGAIDGSVQVTTRDVTAGVTTSGVSSQQEDYNLK